MQTLTDSIFSLATRLGNTRPVAALVDGVLMRIAPKAEATACAQTGYFCSYDCGCGPHEFRIGVSEHPDCSAICYFCQYTEGC